MNINIMTWNTQLYEYGNKLGSGYKELDYEKFDSAVCVIKEHLKKNNSVAVLQEMPYKCNKDFNEHKWFEEFKNRFPDEYYTIICVKSKNDKHIIMTVAIAKKGFIKYKYCEANNRCVSNNRCVYFSISISKELNIFGVHLHDANELKEWLNDESFKPNIIIGDFNAGDYTKPNSTKEFETNKNSYISIINKGYIDICEGKPTFNKKTPIDHILIERCNKNIKVTNCNIDYNETISDHSPIYCEIEVL